MAEYLSPGVYAEEFDSGTGKKEGVDTGTAGFLGMARMGPVKGRPVLIHSFADYMRQFGGYLSEQVYGSLRFLPYAVEQFFLNGGISCYVMRVCKTEGDGAALAARGAVGEAGKEMLTAEAANPGEWGNHLKIRFQLKLEDKAGIPEESGDSFLNLAMWRITLMDDFRNEQYEDVSFHQGHSNYLNNVLTKSRLAALRINASNLDAEQIKALLTTDNQGTYFDLELSGGADASVTPSQVEAELYRGKDGNPENSTGLKCFRNVSDVSIMAIPGITEPGVLTDLITHCADMGNRFAVLDMPKEYRKVEDLLKFRSLVDTSFAAMYCPWLSCYDALGGKNALIPPSGAVAGIYARTDYTRGVHKAPANEIVRGCTGLSAHYNETDQSTLYSSGVNPIRALPGMGIRVWGARTCSNDAYWKYVNVRRLLIFIKESVSASIAWAVFESNDEHLWVRVERTIRVFLTGLWKNEALAGAVCEEAFYISIGRHTMTQDDILNGRLICEIGVAPVRPEEFIIFRITQETER